MDADPTPIGAFGKKQTTWKTGSATDAALKKTFRVILDQIVAPQNTYVYEDIKYHDDIRLLRIFPGTRLEPMRCMLFPSALPSREEHSSSQVHKYKALSYWWGEEEFATNPINITHTSTQDGIRSGTFHIRNNLLAALKQIRQKDTEVDVWVDAICINQSKTNTLEKTAQVARMDEVYSEAEGVYVWLGAGDPYTRETFDFLRHKVLNLIELDRLIQEKETPHKWKLVVDLMTNRWFSRRWVIQELSLAREASVLWGDQKMLWSDFAEAIALFITRLDDIKAIPDTNIGHLDPRLLGANELVEATSNIFRKSDKGKVQQRLVTLEALVSSQFLAFEASEPHDAIYAVISLAKDTQVENSIYHPRSWEKEAQPTVLRIILRWFYRQFKILVLGFFGYTMILTLARKTSNEGALETPPSRKSANLDLRILPDYDKSLIDVCADFMDYCVDTSQSLDILCRHWAPQRKKLTKIQQLKESKIAELAAASTEKHVDPSEYPEVLMPSWIPCISGHAFGGPSGVLHPRRNGDNLVGRADRRNGKHYNASGDLRPHAIFEKFKYFSSMKSGTPDEPFQPNPASPVGVHKHTKSESEKDAKPRRRPKFNGKLRVRGFVLQTIEEVSGRVMDGVLPKEAFEFAGVQLSTDNIPDKIPDKLWRTLVADRGPDGINAPAWYHRACLEVLHGCNSKGDINTEKIKSFPATPVTMKMFLERLQAVTWGRRFFLTKPGRRESRREAMYGLAPENTQSGNVICILYGCSVPVVLKEIVDEPGVYKFVGECYVHGMMDGEALPPTLPKYPYDRMKEFTII